MKRLEKPLEKDKDHVKEEPKIKVCATTLSLASEAPPLLLIVTLIVVVIYVAPEEARKM